MSSAGPLGLNVSPDASHIEPQRFGHVCPGFETDLNDFVELLRTWQATHNLVSPASLEAIWTRHIADSLQLVDHAPEIFESWCDLGSGAGFPGMIMALAYKADLNRSFTLIESNHKKAAFLRAAVRQARVNATVVAKRIEEYGASGAEQADVVSARALASVPVLCEMAAPLLKRGTGVLLLLKGQHFAEEVAAASKSWDFDVVSTPSVTDANGRVLALRNLARKVNA